MERHEIEIFLTLAEELHFGRTAERLRVSSGRVTQVVQKVEREIGGALFERTSRQVRLTALGAQLRDDLLPAYASLRTGIDRARRAAQANASVLRLGSPTWNLDDLRPFFDTFATRHPGCALQVRNLGFAPFRVLRSGDIDVALIWLPVREPDMTVGPTVFTETVVLAMSATHPLAGRESVSLEDLGGRTVIGGGEPAYWRESIVPGRTPAGRPIPVGPHVTTFEQMLPILATGEAISPVHAGAARIDRRDIAFVPIHDAPRTHWALVWRTATETTHTRALATIARELGPIDLA